MTKPFFLTALAGLLAAASLYAEPAPKDMKLFLLIGQSNMAGRGKVEAQDKVENPRILMLTKDLKWVVAKDPVHFDKPAAGVGLASEFAREVLKADPTATIGLIPCAVGGTMLHQWRPGEALYKTAVARTQAALKNGKLAGILWHQGESDNTPALAVTYAERLVPMMGELRKDLDAEKVPLVMGELIHGNGNNDAVNPELAKASGKIPLSVLVSSDGLGKKQLHFNSADLREFGKRYAAGYLKLAKP